MRGVPARVGFGHRFKHFVADLAALAAAGLFAGSALGQTYEVLHAFSAEGGYPQAALVKGSDGRLYGTAPEGGFTGQGSVFVLTPDGNGGFTFTTLHEFMGQDGSVPVAGLIRARDGTFYGTTNTGGAYDRGTVFRMDAAGHVTTIHSFSVSEGGYPYATLLEARNGYFYGTKAAGGAIDHGAVFRMDAGGNVMTLHAFAGTDGDGPSGLIQAADGYFYGTTRSGVPASLGTVFKMDAAGNVTTLHAFNGDDGAYPYSGLIQAADGSFYGTTTERGANGYGTAFRMDAAGNVIALHSFESSDGANPYAALLQGRDGNVFGTTVSGGENLVGTIFGMDDKGSVTTLHSFNGTDGRVPFAALIQDADGTFYGTTSRGGGGSFFDSLFNPGTVFSMDGAGNVTTLHAFLRHDGFVPAAPLIQAADGRFYGTTNQGGTNGRGDVFRMEASGNTTTLHSFPGAVPATFNGPYATLMQAADGSFLGTTLFGFGNSGTIFGMDASGSVTTLHTFHQGDGTNPHAPLIKAADRAFYGTTTGGGADNRGTVFKMDSSGNVTTLHSFTQATGAYPSAPLIQAADGSFYGTTPGGITSIGPGTVFRMDPSGHVTTLHTFTGSGGYRPVAALIQGTDGGLYGTTTEGGAGGWGTVFRMDGSGAFTTLHAFSGSDGAVPYSALVQGRDGSFYGTTVGAEGTNNGVPFKFDGTIFRMDRSGNVTTLHTFGPDDGIAPAGLIQAADGKLYGTAAGGGPGRGGVVFRLTLPCSPLALGPAQLWLGLKNSDDVGTNFDLMAEVIRNGGDVIGSGQVENVPGGGSGFGKAILRAIEIAIPDSLAACLSPGDTLSIRLSVRAGATGHRSGTARLWFNDGAATSRFDVRIGGTTTTLYLRDGFRLGTSPGPGPKKTIDVFVDRLAGGNPWKPFGTWNRTY